MRRRLFREVLETLVPLPNPLRAFYSAVMKRKEDDHHASHNDAANQYLHLISSSVFIYCYATIAGDLTTAMLLGMASLFLRQFGHAVLEPACHEEEKQLLGYNTRNKTLILLSYAVIPLIVMWMGGAWSWGGLLSRVDVIALEWFRLTLFVVFGRVAFLTLKHGFGIAMIWFVKLLTDPFTDVIAYFPRRIQRA